MGVWVCVRDRERVWDGRLAERWTQDVGMEAASGTAPPRRKSCGRAWNNGTWNPTVEEKTQGTKAPGTHPWMPPCHLRQTSHPKCRIENVPWQPLHPFQIPQTPQHAEENHGKQTTRPRPRPRPRCGAEVDSGHRPHPRRRRRRRNTTTITSKEPRPGRKNEKEKDTPTNANEDIDRPTNEGEEAPEKDSCVLNPCDSPSNCTNWCVDCCPRKKRPKGKLGPSTSSK